ncbi:MAG: hypothetical protein Q9192_002483 [Flavoplaca navasiana]
MLPNELFRDISEYLTRKDLKSIRVVCSRLDNFASPLIFTTAVCAARRGVLEAFTGLSNCPKLSQHVRELVYDSSIFYQETVKQFETYATKSESSPDASSSPEGREKYIDGYREQTKILRSELSSALVNAVRAFSNLRRIIYADFSRLPCFRWDRVEDLGPEFRLATFHLPEPKNEALQYPLLQHLQKDTQLRPMYLGFAVLLRELFRTGCKTQIEDLRIGDHQYSRGNGGIPDILFMAMFDGGYGQSTAFLDSIRKLDITLTYCTRRDHAAVLSQFHNLQLLRIVGPMCSPQKGQYAPDLFEPVVRFPSNGEDIIWPHLSKLELKWVASSMVDLHRFLDHHKNGLRFVNLYEAYLDKRNQWQYIVSSFRSIYPDMIIEPHQQSTLERHYDSRIINFTLFNGQAELVDMGGIPSSTAVEIDDYDEDGTSVDHDDERDDSEEESWTSEELEYSEDGAPTGYSSDEDEYPVKHQEDCTANNNGKWELGTEVSRSCNCHKADSAEVNELQADKDPADTIQTTATETNPPAGGTHTDETSVT